MTLWSVIGFIHSLVTVITLAGISLNSLAFKHSPQRLCLFVFTVLNNLLTQPRLEKYPLFTFRVKAGYLIALRSVCIFDIKSERKYINQWFIISRLQSGNVFLNPAVQSGTVEHSQRDQGHRFLCWKMPMNGKLTRRKSLLAQEVLPIIYAKWLPSSFKSKLNHNGDQVSLK